MQGLGMTKNSAGSIAARPCKVRKDGAPTVPGGEGKTATGGRATRREGPPRWAGKMGYVLLAPVYRAC
jgi:hypothetical protein